MSVTAGQMHSRERVHLTALQAKARQSHKGSAIRVSMLLWKTSNFWTQRDGSRDQIDTGPRKLRKGLQSLEPMQKLDAVASLCNENTLTGRCVADVGNLLGSKRPALLEQAVHSSRSKEPASVRGKGRTAL